MSVYEFLRTVAAQLGDDRPGSPFRRYALKDLTAYYQEAMCFVAAHRPDLFTDFTVMKLAPGSYQDARCCGCTNVLEVVAQIDVDGNTVKDLTTTGGSKADVTRWFRPACRTTSNGSSVTPIDSITITPGMNGVFQVSPAVKPGQDVWVKLKCVHAPPAPSEADVLGGASTGDCKFLVAIRSYVLYRALQGDRHAVGATTEAQNEIRNVYTYLGMQYKMEQAQENG
jgi:hypothetical protein